MLEDSVKFILPGVPIMVAGNFNARSATWGDWVSNSRGEELDTLLDSLGLLIINSGSVPTFSREAGSIVDITAVSETIALRINN